MKNPKRTVLFPHSLRRTASRLFVVLGVSLTLASIATGVNNQQTQAATSNTINFQARLLQANGALVPDGNYNVEFKIYNSSVSSGSAQGSCTGDASCLWRETRTGANKVRVFNGYLTVNLGSVQALPAINWSQDLYLAMNIGGAGTSATWDGEMNPRLHLTAVPYALTAGSLSVQQGSYGATVTFATLTNNRSITLPDASGTLCLDQSVNNCGYLTAGGASGSYVAKGTTLETGNFALQSAAATSVGGVLQAATGQTADLLRFNAADGTTLSKFTANGSLVITNSIAVGGAATFNTLAATALTQSGNAVCDNSGNCSAYASGSGSGSYVQNQYATAQTANFNIQSTAAGTATATITRVASQTAPLLKMTSESGTDLFIVYPNGSVYAANAINVGGGNIAGTSLGVTSLQAANTGAIIRGATAQTGDLLQLQNDSGQVLSSFNASGDLKLGSATRQGKLVFTDGTNNGYTASILVNTLSDNYNYVLPDGGGSICTSTTGCGASAGSGNYIQVSTILQANANFNIQTSSVNVVTARIRALNGQTADLQRFESSTGTKLSGFGTDGQLTLGTIATTGTGLQGGYLRFADGTTSGFSAVLQSSTLTASRTINLPDEGGTLCLQNSAACGFAATTGGTGYIQNQSASAQAANFYIQSSNIANVGAIVQGANGQTASVFQVRDGSGNTIFDVKANAQVCLAYGNVCTLAQGSLSVFAAGTTTTTLSVRANTGQTANLIEARDVNNNALSGFNANGQFFSYGTGATIGNLAIPTAIASSTTGTNFYYKITAVNAQGETVGGNEVSGSSAATTISWAAVPGATSYRVYRGTATGAQTGYVTVTAPTVSLANAQSATLTTATVPTTTPGTALTVQGWAGQNNSLFNVNTSGGASFLTVANNGETRIGRSGYTDPYNGASASLKIGGTGSGATAALIVGTNNASTIGTVIKGAASQTADLLQLQGASSTTALSGFNAAGNLYLQSGSFANTLSTTTLTAARAIVLPDESGTICLQGSTACGFLNTTTANANYIQNQSASAQAANFYIQSAVGTAVAAIVQGNATQSVDIFQIKTGSNGNAITVSSSGYLFSNNGASLTQVSVRATATGNSSLSVIGINGQTGDLFTNKDVGTNTLSGFTANGALYTNGTANVLSGLTYPSGISLTTAGTAGSTSYSYRISAVNSQGETIASPEVTIATGNATLSATNYILGTFAAVPGATSYKVYGRTAGAQLFMQTIASTGATNYGFADQGTVTPSGALPVGSGFGPVLTVVGNPSANGGTILSVGNTFAEQQLRVNGFGQTNIRTPNGTAGGLNVGSGGTGQVVAALVAMSGQTADLLQNVNANGVILSGTTAAGALYTNGAGITINALQVPAFTTVSTGTAAYYVITATNAAGETVASTSLGMANSSSTLAWSQVAGATGYKIYRNTSNSFTAGSLLRATITSGTTTSFTDNGAATIAGVPPTVVTGNVATFNAWAGQGGNTVLQVLSSTGTGAFTAAGNGNVGVGQKLSIGNNTAGIGTTAKLEVLTNGTNLGQVIRNQGTGNSFLIQDGSSNPLSGFNSAGNLFFQSGSFTGTLLQGSLTANRSYTLPDVDGTLCTTTTCASGGAGAYIQNGTTTQTANFNIQSASTTGVAATIQSASGGTANTLEIFDKDGTKTVYVTASGSIYTGATLNAGATPNANVKLNVKTSSTTQVGLRVNTVTTPTANIAEFQNDGTNVVAIGSTGATTIKNSTDSTSAFNVQTNAGTNLVRVDTTNQSVNLGETTGETGPWATDASSLPGAQANAGSAYFNGYTYILGGGVSPGSIYYSKMNSDGSFGTWVTASMPTNRRHEGVAISNGYIYIIAGNDGNGNAVSSTYYAKLGTDGTIGSWTLGTSLPAAIQYTRAVAVNGYIYNVGSLSTAATYYAKQNSDGSLGAWSATTSMPVQTAMPGVATSNGYIYSVGGSGNTTGTYYTKVNADGTLGAWQTAANNLPSGSNTGTAVVANGYLYAIGGGASTVFFTKLVNNIPANPWSTSANALPTQLSGHSSAVFNGYIYTFGGVNTGGTTIATIYRASLSATRVGNNLVAGQATFNGSIATISDLLVGGSTQLLSGLSVQGDTRLSNTTIAGTLNVSGATVLGSTLTVAGATVIQSSLQATGALQSGNASTAGSLVLNDGAGFAATLQSATLTANRSFTLPDVGGVICTTTTCAAGAAGNYIQNGTTVQTATFSIQNADTSQITAIIRGASGQATDILRVYNSGGAGLSVNQSGNLTASSGIRVTGSVGFGNTSTLYVNNSNTAAISIANRAAAGQTADLIQNQDQNLNVLSGFNSNGALYTNGTANVLSGLVFPTTVTIANVGTAGSTTYGYRVSALNSQGETLASPTATTTNGNSTLSASNYNTVTFSSVAGATSYKVYGRTSGTELLMTTITSTGAASYVYNDTGTVTPSGSLPTGSGFTTTLTVSGGGAANTASILSVGKYTSGGNFQEVVAVSNSGGLIANGSLALSNGAANTGSALRVTNTLGTTIGGFLQGASSQTADLFQYRDTNGNVLSGVNANGGLFTTGTNNSFGALAPPVITTASTGTAYYYVVTATNGAGETIASNVFGSANNTSAFIWTATGATGFKVYRSSSSTMAGAVLLSTITNSSSRGFTDSAIAGTSATVPTSTTGSGTTIQGWSGQTGSLLTLQQGTASSGNPFQIRNQSGAVFSVGNGGDITSTGIAQIGNTNTTGINAQVSVGARNATSVGVTVQGFTGQTADLLRFYAPASSTILSGFNASGAYYLQSGSFTGTFGVASLTANRTYTLPDADGTVCLQNSASCGFLTGSASDFIQNTTTPQTANFNVTGNGVIGGTLNVTGATTLNSTVAINNTLTVNQTGAGTNIAQFQNNGTTVAKFDPNGNLTVGGNGTAPSITLDSATGTNGTTINFTNRSSGNAYTSSISANQFGYLTLSGASNGGTSSSVVVQAAAANGTAFVVSGMAGQTSSLFQLQSAATASTFGGFDANGNQFSNGTNTNFNNLSAPAAPTVSATGTAYYYAVAAYNSNGTTLPSAATGANSNNNTVSWNRILGATGYRVYRSTTNNFAVGQTVKLVGITYASSTITYADTALTGTDAVIANPTGSTLTVQAWNGQTNSPFQITNAAGATVISAASTGRLTVGALSSSGTNQSFFNGYLQVNSGGVGNVGFTVNGAAGQTADLVQNNVNGSVLSGVNATGRFYNQSGTYTGTLAQASLTANRTYTLPDESGTVCLQNSANCGFLTGTANSYIQNGTAVQTGSNFNIDGNGVIGGTLNVSGASTLASLSVTNNASVGGTLAVTGATTLNSTLAVSGASTFTGALTANGGIATQTIASTTAGIASILFNRSGATGSVNIQTNNDNNVGLAIYGNSATQSGQLLQLRDSTGLVMSSFGATGQLTLGRSLATGTSYQGVLKFADGTNDGFQASLNTTTLTANQTITLPNESGTICLQGSANCGFVTTATGNANYIQNQSATAQSSNFFIQSAAANAIAARIRGAASQSTDILSVESSAGAQYFRVASTGAIGIGNNGIYTDSIFTNSNNNSAGLRFNAGAGAAITATQSGQPVLVVAGASGQTGDLLQLQTTPGTTVAKFDSTGNLSAASITTSGNATIGGNQSVTGTSTVAGNATFSANATVAGNLMGTSASATNYLLGTLGLGTANPQAGDAMTIANGKWISAVDAAGTGFVNILQVNANNEIQLGAALNVDGGIMLPTDGGQVAIADMNFTSAQAAGTANSYTFGIGNSNALTVYGENTGTGTAQNVRVAIGSTIAPAYTLDVAGDINTTTGYRVNGVNINTAGALTNVAYLNQANTFTANQTAPVFNASTGFRVNGAAAAGQFLRGDGTNFVSSAIQASDVPDLSTSYIRNQTTQQASSNFNISGAGVIGTTLNVSGATTLAGLSATNGSFSGTLGVTGNSTFTGSLTANGGVFLNSAAAANNVLSTQVTGDTNARFTISADGTLKFGAGTSAVDAYLNRDSANRLSTGRFVVNDQLRIGGTEISAGQLAVKANSATTVGQVLRGASSQTADLFQLQDNSANVLTKFNANGGLTLGTIATSGTVQGGSLTFSDGTTSGYGATITSSTLTANRAFTLPNVGGEICTSANNCGYGTATGSFINNGVALQSSANFNIDGTGKAATINATGALQLNGTNINTAGTLSNVAYLNQANTFTGNLSVSGSNSFTTGTGTVTIGSLGAGVVQSSSTGVLSSGTLTVANGGTGFTSATTNGIVFGNGTSALGVTAAGTSGQLLVANASGVPTFVSLSGDVTVSATGVTTIANNAITTAKIADGAVTNVKLANSSITVTPGTNLTTGGTVALGGSVTLNVANSPSFSGSVNAATGFQFNGAAAAGQFLRGNGTNFVSSAIQASDVPDLSTSYIKNQTAQQASSNFNISGAGVIGTTLNVSGATTLAALSATNGTFSGTLGVTGNTTLGGTLGVTGAASFSGGITSATTTGTGVVFQSQLNAEANPRFTVNGNGLLAFGNGTGAPDTYLFRPSSTAGLIAVSSSLGVNTTTKFAQLGVQANNSTVGFAVRAGASQSSDLLQLQNNDGTTVYAKFDATGNLTVPTITTTGNASIGGTLTATGAATLNGGVAITGTATVGGSNICTAANNCGYLVGSAANFIANQTTQQASSNFNISGAGVIGTTLNVSGATTLAALSATTGTFSGALTLQGATTTNFTTPVGSNVPTKINVPLYNVPAFGQIIALGLNSSAADSARGISLFDARTGAHQPTISVFSPDESQVFGLSYEGTNNTGYLKVSGGGITLRSNNTDILSVNTTGANAPIFNAATGFQVAGAAATGQFLRGNGTNFVSSALTASDITAGSANYIQNTTTQQASSNFNISGAGVIGTTLNVAGATTLAGLSATNGSFSGTLSVTGASTFNGAITANAGITASSAYVNTSLTANSVLTGTINRGDFTGTGVGLYANDAFQLRSLNSATHSVQINRGYNNTQTGDLLQLQNSDATVLGGFNATGQLYYKSGSYTGTIAQATLSANQTYTLPSTGGTLCTTTTCTTGSAANYIQNTTTQQASSNFNISGAGVIGTTLNVSGATTLAALSATNGSFSGTLGVTGNTTLGGTLSVASTSTFTGALTANGGISTTTLTTTGNATVGGTLTAVSGLFSAAGTNTGVTAQSANGNGIYASGSYGIIAQGNTTSALFQSAVANNSNNTVVIKAGSGQTGDLINFQNNSSSTNGGINASGQLYYNNSSFAATLNTATLTANRTITMPNASGTICLDSNNCNFATTGQYIVNGTAVQAGGNFNISGNGVIGGTLSVTGLTTVKDIFVQGASKHYSFNDATTTSGSWMRLGTLTLSQYGSNAVVKVYAGGNYNGGDDQDARAEIYLRTSNGNANGVTGMNISASYANFGTINAVRGVKVVGNAAGNSATAYTIYVQTQDYIGNGFYTVDSSDNGSWVNNIAGVSDPGAASSTVLVARQFYSVNQTLRVTDGRVALNYGFNDPDATLSVGAQNASTVGIRVVGDASATADFAQFWRGSALKSGVNAQGTFYYQNGSYQGLLQQNTLTASRSYYLPDASGTICLDSSVNNCAYAANAGSNNYIQNTNTQQTANFNISGNGTVGGTLTTGAFTATSINTGSLTATGTIQGATLNTTGALNQNGTTVLTSGRALQNLTGIASTGNFQLNTGAANQLSVVASAAPTADMVNITNSGQPTTTGGVSGQQIDYFANLSGTSEASAQRLNITSTSTAAGSVTNGLRVVVSNSSTGGVNGIKIDNISSTAVTRNAISLGTGWANLLSYNGTSIINGTGILQNASLSGQYTGITGTGALSAGSIAAGFGTINTNNDITTSTNLQGGTVSSTSTINAVTGYRINGAATTGTFLRGNGTNYVSGTIQASDIPDLGTNYIKNGTTAQTGAFNIQGTTTNLPTAQIQGASGQSVDIFQVRQNGVGSSALSVTSDGQTFVGNNLYVNQGGVYTNSVLRVTNAGALQNITGFTQTSGNATFNQAAGNQLLVAAAAVPTADQVRITNSGFPATADGINGQQIDFYSNVGTSGQQTSAQRINVTNTSGTTGANTNGLRIVATSNVASNTTGLRIDGITSANGNIDSAFFVGAGWDNILNYNGTALISGGGILQNAALSNAIVYNNITGVGALTSGSIGTGFGAISTANDITTTTNIQGSVINATTGFRVAGAATSGQFLKSNGTNFVGAALLATDIPAGSINYIQNGTATQSASFNVNGSGQIGTTLNVGGATTITTLSATNGTFSGTLGVTGAATIGGNLTASGDIINGNQAIYNLSRTLPTTVNNTVDVGTFNLTNGNANFNIRITSPSSCFAVNKTYDFAMYYNSTNGAWQRIQPSGDTGSFCGNDYNLEASNNNNGVSFRVRRTAGTDAGTVNLTITRQSQATDTFSPSTAVTTGAAVVTAYLIQSNLTQYGANVGIGTVTPTFKLEVAGSFSATTINAVSGFRVNGAAAAGNYLRGDGTNFVASPLLAADIPTGSANYIQNGTTLQVGNFAVQSSNGNNVGAVIQRASAGQNVDLLQFKSSDGSTVLANFNQNGQLFVPSLQTSDYVTVGSTLTTHGNVTFGAFDFKLGNDDQTSRGNSGLSRAMVKDGGNVLTINYNGDYTGGTKINSNLNVSGTSTVAALTGTSLTSSGTITVQGTGTSTVAGPLAVGSTTLNANAFTVSNGSTVFLQADSQNTRTLFGTTNTPTLSSAKLVATIAEVQTTLRVGDASNGVSYNDGSTGASGKLRLYGSARNAKKVTLTAEYAGAVLDPGTSTNTAGTLTAGYNSSRRENYYDWTNASSTAASYDVVVSAAVPSDWSAWSGTSVICLNNFVTNANATVKLTVLGTSGGAETNASAATASTSGAWNTYCFTPGATYVADGLMTVRITMTAASGAEANIGNLTFSYLSAY